MYTIVWKAVNITIDSICIIICSIIMIAILVRRGGLLKSDKWFLGNLFVNIILSASDIFTWLCPGMAEDWYPVVFPIAMYTYYICTFLVVICQVMFVATFIGWEYINKVYRYILAGATGIYYCLLGMTPFTGAFFTIDSRNIYTRGEWLFIAYYLSYVLYVIPFILVLSKRRHMDHDKILPFLSLTIFPFAAMIIQLLFPKLSLVSFGITLAFLVIFININKTVEYKLIDKNRELEASHEELIHMQDETIISLSNLVENRDTDTSEHVRRTGDYVEALARQTMKNGFYPEILNEKYIQYLKKAAPMHDIGKIVVSDIVLKKPGRLTPEERLIIQKHTTDGSRIVGEVLGNFKDQEHIRITQEIALCHHEKWDGTGYPNGLYGQEIPLSARFMAIADVFDALVSERCYKQPLTYEETFEIIRKGTGTHFDPVLAEQFLSMRDEIIAINEKYKH